MHNRQYIKWSLVTKLVCTALPSSEGRNLVSMWRHWQKHKGDAWLSNRVKSLWIVALLLKSGDLEKAIQVLVKNRICHSNGIPAGIEGSLIHRFLEAEKPSVLRRLSAVLRFYTVFQQDRPREDQLNSARDNITSGHLFPVRYLSEEESRFLTCKVLQYHDIRDKEKGLTLPPISRLSGISVFGQGFVNSRDRRQWPYLNVLTSMCSNSHIPESLEDFWGEHDSSLEEFRKAQPRLNHLGALKAIPEQGQKIRIACSPDAWTQLYCIPFHDSLSRYISRLEENGSDFGISCMYHQSSGADFIRKSLQEGKPTFCVDLSSATDNFPVEVQQWILENLGWKTFSKVIRDLKGPYLPPKEYPDPTPWEYGCGQPMGAYGSFPSFHLSHFVLMQSLCIRLGLDPSDHHFAVLGDDIIITNERLHELYREFLRSWEIPISEHKSFSGNVAEFAGFIAIKNSKGNVTIFRPYKWKVGGNHLAVIPTVFAFSNKVKVWSQYWSNAYTAFWSTMSSRDLDLSPLFRITDPPGKSSTKVDPRYIASLANIASFSGLPTYDSSFDEDHIEFKLLQKDTESSDLQYESNISRDIFDPEQYALEEEERKRSWKIFYQDPLIAQVLEARQTAEED